MSLPVLSILILATVPRLDAKGVVIEKPAPDQLVPRTFVVNGRYKSVPTDNVLWLMTSDRQGDVSGRSNVSLRTQTRVGPPP